jgi:hypothetical protein
LGSNARRVSCRSGCSVPNAIRCSRSGKFRQPPP